jgi:hypothetical protein
MIILAYVALFSRGQWPSTGYTESAFGRVREQGIDSPIPYNAYYSSRIYYNRTMVWNVGV